MVSEVVSGRCVFPAIKCFRRPVVHASDPVCWWWQHQYLYWLTGIIGGFYIHVIDPSFLFSAHTSLHQAFTALQSVTIHIGYRHNMDHLIFKCSEDQRVRGRNLTDINFGCWSIYRRMDGTMVGKLERATVPVAVFDGVFRKTSAVYGRNWFIFDLWCYVPN